MILFLLLFCCLDHSPSMRFLLIFQLSTRQLEEAKSRLAQNNETIKELQTRLETLKKPVVIEKKAAIVGEAK